MRPLEQTTPAQDQAIDQVAMRWREVRDRPAPIARDQAAAALAALYRYADLTAPPVTFYESPDAALVDRERWKKLVGRIDRIQWRGNLSLCRPDGFRYRDRSARGPARVVDLGVRRWANAHGVYVYQEPLPDLAGVPIAGTLLDTILHRIHDTLGWGWCDSVAEVMEVRTDHHDAINTLYDDLRDSPFTLSEHIYLGPCDWLVAEAACAEICTDVLGVRMNPAYVATVADVARCCGLVYALEGALLACERPRLIERTDDLITAHFPDGTRVAAHRSFYEERYP